MGLTCDIQGDWGLICCICAQLAGESGTIIIMDDRCNTHAAVTLLIFILQTDHSFIPQPDQLFIVLSLRVAVRQAQQRHSLLQLYLYNTFTVDYWVRLDLDTLGAESWIFKMLLSEAVKSGVKNIWLEKINWNLITYCLGCTVEEQKEKRGAEHQLHFLSWMNLEVKKK